VINRLTDYATPSTSLSTVVFIVPDSEHVCRLVTNQ